MKKLMFLIVFVSIPLALNAQILDAKGFPIRIRDNAGSNGWSPDGKLFVTYTRAEGKTRLLTLKDERVIWEVSLPSDGKESGELSSQTFTWTKSQKHLLVRTANGEVFLLNASNGKIIWKNRTHHENLEAILFSPDEKQIVLAFSNEKALIQFWNSKTGKLENTFKTNVKSFDSFSFSNDGKLLNFGNFEGKATFIDSADGDVVKELALKPCGDLPNTFSNGTEFSPHFSYLVARCGDKTVITNVTTGKVIRILEMKTDFEKTIGFSGDERILVLENLGYTVFDFSDNSVFRLEDPELWFDIDLNHDGSLLMNNTDYKHRGYEILETQTGKVLQNFEDHPGEIKALAFSPDGSLFVSGSTDRVLRIWDTRSKTVLFSLAGHTNSINSVEFSADGRKVVSKSKNETITWNPDHGKRLNDEKSGSEDSEALKATTHSPSQKYILQDLGDDVPFQLLDATGRVLKKFPGLTQIQGFVFMPDERSFISAAYFQPLQLWDVESGKRIREFDIGYSHTNVVAFDPKGKVFITGGSNRNILMYNYQSGKLLWSLFPIDQDEMRSEIADEQKRVTNLREEAEYAKRADLENRDRVKKITAKFSHYGDAESFWDQKIAENGVANKSKLKLPKDKARVAWFTLSNDADMRVSIETNSMIFDQKCSDLCNGAEISSRYVMELKNGETRVNGFDMYSNTLLPPNTTIYFSVSLEDLSMAETIYLCFTFQKDNPQNKYSDDFGTEQKLYLRESDLPK